MSDGVNGRDLDADQANPGAAAEPTLAEVVDDLADDFADVERVDTPAGTDFTVGGIRFVHVAGPTVHFLLRPEVVAAATRTGDASASALGSDWVAFSPSRLDQYALDRAQSWFELGHRLVVSRGGTRRH